MTSRKGWIGVDLDATLAEYDTWRGIEHIGNPVPAMLNRVKLWLSEGKDVRIFTARVDAIRGFEEVARATRYIEMWCLLHLDQILPVTNVKDFAMIELWDDRAVRVQKNTGKIISYYEEDTHHG